MGTFKVLPYKRRVEVLTIKLDFADRMELGETIVSTSLAVSVFSGEDANPADVNGNLSTISGTKVTHVIKQGLPGVVYELVFSVVTSLTQVLSINARQAVVQDGLPAGPLYASFFYTTTPYPINVIENLASSSSIVKGYFFYVSIDMLQSSSSIQAGTLRDILKSYSAWPFEGIDCDSTIQSGELRDILKSYEIPFEGIDCDSTIQSGTLVNTLVSYTNWPAEGIDCDSTIISGSLV